MKTILLLILTIFITSFSYSYSQSHIGKNESKIEYARQVPNIGFVTPLRGIKIDSDRYSKSESYVDQDTSRARNEIKKVYSRDQLKFIVEIQLKEYNIPIKILVFNMLGNLVKEAYNGAAIRGVDYDFDASNLPNGLYLCILEGPNFRDAEKFTISR